MTTKEIKRALRSGCIVRVGNEPQSCITLDLFGDLVVVDFRHNDEPIRKATLSDKRRAVAKEMRP